MPFSIFGQSYKYLWEQVMDASRKDLPKTQMAALDKIVKKATQEKQYGQLLKAQLMHASLQVTLSPDSLDPVMSDIALQAQQAERKDAALSAVYNCIAGSIYRSNARSYEADDADKAKAFLAKAMEHPDILAKHKASEYEPLIESGVDSEIFDKDLLSLIGYQTGDYATMHDYYLKAGNRRAAMLTALEMVKQQHQLRKYKLEGSPYAAALDSLINLYGDLQECGEVAVERAVFINQCSDVPLEKRISYFDEVIARWGGWKHTNQVRNMSNALTQPQFRVRTSKTVYQPGKQIVIDVENARNIRQLTLTVSRVNITGDNEYYPGNQEHYNIIRKSIVAGSQKTYTRTYNDKKEFELSRDRITVDGLPMGAYLLEFKTDNSKIAVQKMLIYVSNLMVLSEELPGKQVRIAVVDATTGQPVPQANIKVYSRKTYNKPVTEKTLTCNAKGEALYAYKNEDFQYLYAYTNTDKWCQRSSFQRNRFNYYEDDDTESIVRLYTDRRIYRPGQTVHLSGIAFTNAEGLHTEATSGKSMKVVLRNANYKEVKTVSVTTDEYGTFAADFALPTNGLTGNYSIHTDHGNGYANIRVEEYKRPTFEVEFDEVKTKYKNGDTITVTGRAKSYAGVPVQGANVRYTLLRRKAIWCWWWGMSSAEETDDGEVVTDEKGEFRIQMPLQLPSWEDDDDDDNLDEEEYYRRPRFYDFIAKALVTDLGGESHEGSISVPLGSKPTAFYCDVPEQIERDSLKTITFTLYNAAGQAIDGTVDYTIDGKNRKQTAANQPVKLNVKSLKSGKHTIEAVCGTDSIKKEFIVFSLKDKSPCIETHDWFYQTDTTFPRDGKPVTLQVGASDPDTHILYTIISGDKILENGTIDQSNAINTREFAYKEQYGSGLLLTYAWVKDGICYKHSTTIERPLPDKKMQLKWSTFRDRLTPGQNEEWTLNIQGPDRKPAAAQLLVTMYDKSLDQLAQMSWGLDLGINQSLPNTRWGQLVNPSQEQYGYQRLTNHQVKGLQLSHFVNDILNLRDYSGMIYRVRQEAFAAEPMVTMDATDGIVVRGMAPMRKTVMTGASAKVNAAGEGALYETLRNSDDEEAEETDTNTEEPQVRENLNETAFFYPALLCDEKGNVNIRFTLPESITTWKFIGLAHDKQMNYGIINAVAVAKKDVMVQPNMPRFIRVGDKATVSTRIFNTAERDVSGNVKMILMDPETDQIVYESEQPFSVKAGETANATFGFEPTECTPALLVCKIIARGEGFSDGEQHYLPILPDREMTITTVPFTQHEPGTKVIDLTTLLPENATSKKLTVEYTNNPAWMMVQALPFVGDVNEKNAISLASAYYANSIGKHIIGQSARIKLVFQQWQQEQGNETSLMSSLEKDQNLKSLILDETPWVMNAERESDQKKAIANFFDENALQNRQTTALEQLRRLQNGDGSFSWWEGMRGSPAMTAEVMEFLTRLNMLCGNDSQTERLLSQANKYLSGIVIKEVAEMKRLEKEKKPYYINGYHALQWVYLNAIADRQLNAKEKEATDFLMNYLEKQILTESLYAKALMAVVLHKQGKTAKALDYLKSLNEYSVYKEEMGRYYDTPRARYSWFDYRIPTQTAAIEALQLLTPNDLLTINDMKRWLLQEKRTQSWDTPINSVNAVFAFLNGNTRILANQEQTKLSINGNAIELPKATAGLGYVKTAVAAENAKTFTAEKTSTGTSWGAVYAQCMMPVSEIEASSSGITVKREILPASGADKHSGTYHVGDKVKIRITIIADRDYDFIQLIDKRAACLEPVNQLSGYRWGYYCAPKDYTTNYYFDLLSKGRHTIETEYYIDRAGTYETGTCTVQCAYTPEFTGRSTSQTIHVE